MPKNKEPLPNEEDRCGHCQATGLVLMLCQRCQSVSYCGAACQKSAWKTHKKHCQPFVDGRGWELLSPLQRRELRAHHLATGCTVAWPLCSAEVPEMLQRPMPSFLLTHPNQRFKVAVQQLPSFRIEMPGADVDGKNFPSGMRLPVLQEFLAGPCTDETAAEHLKRVPGHAPMPSEFAVLGEVVWTPDCKRELAAFYDHGGSGGDGKFFRWPGGDAIGVCPCTGETVKTDGRTRHILVACEMQGQKAVGSHLHSCTRILPRILTRLGFESMVDSSQACTVTLRHTSTGDTTEENVPFFPKGIHFFSLWGDKAPPAGVGWSDWHAEGAYAAYERLQEDKRRKLGSELRAHSPSAGESPFGTVSGRSSGPSTYEPVHEARGHASEKLDPTALQPGTRVRIKGLGARADLNGRQAFVLEWDAQAQRLAVRVLVMFGEAETRVKLRPSNFELEWATPTQPDPLTGGPCPCCHDTSMITEVGEEQNASLMFCCGKAICNRCLATIAVGPRARRDICALCGEDTSDTSDSHIIRLLKRHAHTGGAPTCQYNLAAYYDFGHKGLRRNPVEARRLYELAAKQGHRRAAHDLGCSHRDGDGGPKDPAAAFRWFQVAAELGHVKAQCNLGLAYQRGEGVSVDVEEAFKWLSMAAKGGDSLALRALGH